MNPKQLKKYITYILIDMDMYSESAVDLLMLTAAHESHLGEYIEQLGNGPAKGIFQMEPATHNDIWEYLQRKGSDFRSKTINPYMIDNIYMSYVNQVLNLTYQIAMARLHYWRVPTALPIATEFQSRKDYMMAIARYWKKYWNTKLGSGTVIRAYMDYINYVEERI